MSLIGLKVVYFKIMIYDGLFTVKCIVVLTITFIIFFLKKILPLINAYIYWPMMTHLCTNIVDGQSFKKKNSLL